MHVFFMISFFSSHVTDLGTRCPYFLPEYLAFFNWQELIGCSTVHQVLHSWVLGVADKYCPQTEAQGIWEKWLLSNKPDESMSFEC